MGECLAKAEEKHGQTSEEFDVELQIQELCKCDPAAECTSGSGGKSKARLQRDALRTLAATCCNPAYGVEDWPAVVGDPEACDLDYDPSEFTISGFGFDGNPPDCIGQCVGDANQRFADERALLAAYCKCAEEVGDLCDVTSLRNIEKFLGDRCEDPSLEAPPAPGNPKSTVRCVKGAEDVDMESALVMKAGRQCREYYESIRHADHMGLKTNFGYDCAMGHFCTAEEMASLGFVPAEERKIEEVACMGNTGPPKPWWEEEDWWQEEQQWMEDEGMMEKEKTCPYMLNTLMMGWEWEYHGDVEKPGYYFSNYYYYDGGVAKFMKDFEPEHNGHCMMDLGMFGEHLNGLTLCDICCETCAAMGMTCGPPESGCVKAGWRHESDECAEGEVAERTCPTFEGMHGMGVSGWEWRAEWMIPASPVAEAGDVVKVVAVTTELSMSVESLEAMQENPKRAVKGLTAGIADGLGVHPGLVTITRTVPDLLSGGSGRRLGKAVPLVVEFEVDVSQSEDPAGVTRALDSMLAGDEAVVEGMAESVTAGLAKVNIEVEIAGMSAEIKTVAPAPEPTSEEPEFAQDSYTRDMVGVGMVAALLLQFSEP
jgi:hypothetical protein